MNKEELLKLNVGVYELTDNIDNYNYTLQVLLDDNNKKCFRIKEKGSLSRNSFFITEDVEKDDDGNEYGILYCIASIGGLSVHTVDGYKIINELKFK
jgi:hypothetical protein